MNDRRILHVRGIAALAGMLLSAQAAALISIPHGPSASVADTVTALAGGRWQFAYQVSNLTPCVISDCTFADGDIYLTAFDIPYFSDAAITSVADPTGWAHSIETTGTPNPFSGGGGTGWDGNAAWQDPADPNYQGAGSPFTSVDKVLHWYAIPGFGGAGTVGIAPESNLAGFGYEAGFPGTKSPHQTVLQDNVGGAPVSLSGDPRIPNSPSISSVPLPASLWVLLSALAGLLFIGSRRKGPP